MIKIPTKENQYIHDTRMFSVFEKIEKYVDSPYINKLEVDSEIDILVKGALVEVNSLLNSLEDETVFSKEELRRIVIILEEVELNKVDGFVITPTKGSDRTHS